MISASDKPPCDVLVRPGSGVVFLDYDGVIMTLRTCLAAGTSWSRAMPDPVLCAALRRICAVGVKIVVSSAWRDHEPSTKAKLVEGGLIDHLHADWRTKELRSKQAYSDRPEEVAEWLSRHPEIESYRILDDDPWAWTPEQAERFLQCDAHEGASATVIKALIDWARPPRQNTECSGPEGVRSAT